jgi:hypothetical protein
MTEGEEAANHHSTASERTRAKREMHGGPEGKTEANGEEVFEDKGHLSDNTEADIITERRPSPLKQDRRRPLVRLVCV